MMLLHLFGDRHHLVDADAALVAVALAVVAADGAVAAASCRRDLRSWKPACSSASGGMSAGALQFAHSFRARRCAVMSMTRRRDVERRDAHVQQARQRRRRVVGVQRRQHHVAGLRGLDRDVGGLEVADFADHDDVRILAQERLAAPPRTSARPCR